MVTKKTVLGITLIYLFLACGGGGDDAGTTPVSNPLTQFAVPPTQTPPVDSTPTFGEPIAAQKYIHNSAMTPLILPEANGGNGKLTYSLTPIPAGLSFNSGTRMLSGIPTSVASSDLTYTVQDEDGDFHTTTFTVNIIVDRQPGIVSETIDDLNYIQNSAITPLTLPEATSGNTPLEYNLFPMPAGLLFDSTTRELSGTPTRLGSTTLTYTVEDTDGDTDTAMFTVNIVADTQPSLGIQIIDDQEYPQGVAITPLTLPEATSGNTPLEYNLFPMPAGLLFDSTTRELSGTPTRLGSTTLTYIVEDTDGDETIYMFIIAVVDPATLPSFAEEIDDQVYIQGIARGSVTLSQAIGGDGDLTYTLAPLPDGLIFDSGTRELSGFPTAFGSTIVTYTATDADMDTAELTFNVIYRIPQIKNIFSRTQQVRDAILAKIHETDNTISYSTVTELHLAGVTDLTLSREDITSLQTDDFDDLVGLQTLTISYNHELRDFPEGVFDELSSLQTLTLDFNSRLRNLPEGVFDELSSLQTLTLINNQVTTLPEGVFDELSSLTELIMDTENLGTLPEDIFDGLSSLTNLELTANDLQTLPEDVFDGLSSLTNLDLSCNYLRILPEDVFDGLSSLTNLDLSYNDLMTLPTGLFDGLQLVVLNLGSNLFNTPPAVCSETWANC